MIHEAGLAAYLEGDLGDAEVTAWDAHLLSCDACWRALDEARHGHALASSLRESAPARVRDRVVVAVEAAARPAGSRRRLTTPRVVGVAMAAVVTAAAFVVTSGPDAGTHDPESIAAVLRLAADGRDDPPTVDQGVVITRLHVNGREVVLARSDRPFPMPEGAIALADDPHSPWLARRGEVNLLCYSHPSPMLLAGQASPATLTQVAAALGIAPP